MNDSKDSWSLSTQEMFSEYQNSHCHHLFNVPRNLLSEGDTSFPSTTEGILIKCFKKQQKIDAWKCFHY